MVSVQDNVQETLTRLQMENEALKQGAHLFPEANSDQVKSLEEELRLTLQEVALLKTALLEADQKLAGLKNSLPVGAGPNHRSDEVAALAQELRQPLSSIVGYTDFLLSELVGLLGSLQQKFLQRIEGSARRLSHLVDDLILVTTSPANQNSSEAGSVDLLSVIDEAIAQTSANLREKNIYLRLNLPESLPHLNADEQVLQQIVAGLVQNAGNATPVRGNIYLRAAVERGETGQDFVLLQIADTGAGIDPENLSGVFGEASNQEGRQALDAGVDFSLDLSAIKALVEPMGGRIWMDSDPGHGTAYSILLPVSQRPLENAGESQ